MTSMSKDGLLCNGSAAPLKASCGKGRPPCLVLMLLGGDGEETSLISALPSEPTSSKLSRSPGCEHRSSDSVGGGKGNGEHALALENLSTKRRSRR